MPKPTPDSRVLQGPKVGPQQELTPEAAYLAAVTSLPRLIHEQTQVLVSLVNVLDEATDKLDMIALYHERKGRDEGLLGPDDLSNDDGPESKESADEPGK